MRDRRARRRYRGWAVLLSSPAEPRDRVLTRCAGESEARAVARTLNAALAARGPRAPLVWAEYWSTSSTLERRDAPLA